MIKEHLAPAIPWFTDIVNMCTSQKEVVLKPLVKKSGMDGDALNNY
jgi:hypothetical protein